MRRILILALGLSVAGCGGTTSSAPGVQFKSMATPAAAPKFDAAPASETAPRSGEKLEPINADLAPPAAPEVARLVIHTATIELIVKDIAATQAAVERLVESAKGYVAKSDLAGSSGGRRSATYTIKVPVGAYRTALAELAALGSLVKQTADSQDVTEEFYDLNARVKSLKVEEEVLQKLLKEAVARLDEIIKIREQIKIVRLDIDRSEGRMKFLSTRADLSTITLTAREEEPFVAAPVTPPPTPPTYGAQVTGTFGESLGVLERLGKSLFLSLVAAAPFLPFAVIGLFLLRLVARNASRPIRLAGPPAAPRKFKLDDAPPA